MKEFTFEPRVHKRRALHARCVQLRFNTVEQAKEAGAITWNIGLFINAVIKFLIVAFAVFLLVEAINRLRREVEQPEAAPQPAPDVELLREIRDLLAGESARTA
jgi:large conductance mechanosensitive channel protein